ncbi:PREDICTED: uncharacterized protein LOC109584489 isoform X2 [Amphimedon queenslandica]|uniref:Uncharacterized protein n=1 Tax=Amphimedon queenslandica TaxID=400682 RepID=A0AAN0JG84_AMPQE|nr:PREDICTED: uncharacterized protein LOC109584489 isoform X2 [Amphimedon queenslandica]|eukprot:XP_019855811.1 PREDICTED: uncharacterized protein LOC109584489 isoform X2 [Amphimedon queenslandica]
MAYFDGLIFSFCSLEDSKKSRKGSSQLVLARGGQYNKLLESLREKRQVMSAPYSSPSSLPPLPSLSGVSINEEVLVKVLCKTYVDTGQSLLSHSLSKCQGLICSLNPDIPLHDECLKLVQDLRDLKGLLVDHLYHHLELEDLQDFCCRRHIPHLIIIDNSLLVRNQYKLRSLDTDKGRVISERVVSNIQELIEYIIPKHSIERKSPSSTI